MADEGVPAIVNGHGALTEATTTGLESLTSVQPVNLGARAGQQ
jgi:hypothetical protein